VFVLRVPVSPFPSFEARGWGRRIIAGEALRYALSQGDRATQDRLRGTRGLGEAKPQLCTYPPLHQVLQSLTTRSEVSLQDLPSGNTCVTSHLSRRQTPRIEGCPNVRGEARRHPGRSETETREPVSLLSPQHVNRKPEMGENVIASLMARPRFRPPPQPGSYSLSSCPWSAPQIPTSHPPQTVARSPLPPIPARNPRLGSYAGAQASCAAKGHPREALRDRALTYKAAYGSGLSTFHLGIVPHLPRPVVLPRFHPLPPISGQTQVLPAKSQALVGRPTGIARPRST